MPMPRVTVLVAVYNAEPWLPRCLDSLRSQTLCDLQVLCVDDCSTDGSLSLLRQYAEGDPRFEVIHLERNQGQAHARNVGLEHARGDLVCFLDADDWFSPDALQQAVSVMDAYADCDSVLFDLRYEQADGSSQPYPMTPFSRLTGEEAFHLSLDWRIHGVYMVRTELHRQYPYDETCRAYSDDNTSRLHFLASRSVRCCTGVYHYRQHFASTTRAVNVRRYDFLRANESMKLQLRQMGAAAEVMRRWETIRLLTLVDVYMFHHYHSRQLPYADRVYGLAELHRVWKTLERNLIDKKISRKFGYRLMPCWTLFRVQECLYFTLKRWKTC